VREQDEQDFARSIALLARRLARCPRNGRGRAISEELWSRVAVLAAQHGVSRTARALGLSYSSVRRRVKTATSVPEGQPAFVEWLVPLSSPSIAECILEVPSCRGGSLRLELRNAPVQGLAALVRELAG
jgi:hypothetical protein